MKSATEVSKAVASDRDGVGYVSVRTMQDTTRALAIGTVVGAITLGAASGVFGTFYSTLQSGMSCTYGYGYDSGYGYGYGYGSANGYDCVTNTPAPAPAPTPSSNGGGGAGPIAPVTPTPVTPVIVNKELDALLTAIKSAIPGITIDTSKLMFKDLTNNWSKSYVEKLAMRGIVNNASSYNPEGRLTRAEFLKIVIKTSGWNTDGVALPGFADVKSTHTLSKFIALAAKKGLVNKDAKNFRPDDTITRAEAMKILVGVLGADVVTDTTPGTFADVVKTSDLAKFVNKAKALGIISGQGSKFRPNDSMSRAEIAKVVVNAFKL